MILEKVKNSVCANKRANEKVYFDRSPKTKYKNSLSTANNF